MHSVHSGTLLQSDHFPVSSVQSPECRVCRVQSMFQCAECRVCIRVQSAQCGQVYRLQSVKCVVVQSLYQNAEGGPVYQSVQHCTKVQSVECIDFHEKPFDMKLNMYVYTFCLKIRKIHHCKLLVAVSQISSHLKGRLVGRNWWEDTIEYTILTTKVLLSFCRLFIGGNGC